LDTGAGDDILAGGVGNDSLIGGPGADMFRFDTALSAANNLDKIIGFLSNDDSIQLDNAIFSQLLTEGALSAYNFRASAGGTAADLDDFILYNTNSGTLYYDEDGSGTGVATPFVTLIGTPLLTAADFNIS
jgi:Ca2+-binding RTX toxin-like protein